MLFLLVRTGLCLYLVLSDHARWLHNHPAQFNLEDEVSMLVATDKCALCPHPRAHSVNVLYVEMG
jgi:hypothetical protein